MKPLMPDKYRGMSDQELIRNIKDKKAQCGNRLVILGHHYQREEVVKLSDFRGDSLQLSRNAANQQEAQFTGISHPVKVCEVKC